MTGRSLPADLSSALAGNTVQPFWCVDLLFDTPNEMYLWSGRGDLSLDGNTYQGVGNFLDISEIRESSDIASYGATLTLSGIDSTILSRAKSEPYQGRRCIVKFGTIGSSTADFLLLENGDYILLENGDKIIIEGSDVSTSSFTVFTGEMDQMHIHIGPKFATISLDVESRLVDLRRSRIRRYTHADQISRYSGDLAFEFVTRLQNEGLEWAG